MTSDDEPAPTQVTNPSDPGDETLARYRYQCTYAAIMCCALLSDFEDVCQVYCEQFEDILLQHDDGRFTGVQIKTRASTQNVWKANDSDLRQAFANFVKHDSRFSRYFRAYRFLTNHPLHSASNGQDVNYVLDDIRDAASLDALRPATSRFLHAVAALADESAETTLLALKKSSVDDRLPRTEDIMPRLTAELAQHWSRGNECSHDILYRSAEALVMECFNASSRHDRDTLPPFVFAREAATDEETAREIQEKKFDKERVNGALDRGFEGDAPLRRTSQALEQSNPDQIPLMRRKLDTGGFSYVSCNAAENLRDAAEYLGVVWLRKYGPEHGKTRYDHIRSVALTEAARSFERTNQLEATFGPDMLREFLERIRRRRLNGEQLYDCTDDHIEGFAYSLTAQCQVVWSTERPWEES